MEETKHIAMRSVNDGNGYNLQFQFIQKDIIINFKIFTDEKTDKRELLSTVKDLEKVIKSVSKNETVHHCFEADRFIHSIEYEKKDVFNTGTTTIRIGDDYEHQTVIKMLNYPSLIEDLVDMKDFLSKHVV